MNRRVLVPLFLAAGVLWAYPMGNFSVSHYSRITVQPGGASIRYVLDLGEIPAFELLQEWKADASTPQAELDRHALAQAREWAGKLKIAIDGAGVKPAVEHAQAVLDKGAGGMPVVRVIADLHVAAQAGAVLTYEDSNYPDRAGWKEIVTGDGPDRSKELTAYPQDPLLAPPQDLKVSLKWSAPGMVVRGDFLSRLLHQGEIGWGATIVGMFVAFGLGAIHALSPGHGKTIVAAYLVGSRGTAKHAAFLGAMVTFTHTISVFFLGFVTLFLSKYVLPEKIYPVLGAISGISIVWIGTTLFFKRMRSARGGHDHHHHHHHHDHHHDGALTHDHGDGHVHSHVPEGEVTLSSLVALGASGGLVPCPSALVLLLSSVALGRVALGLTLLVAFSTGLAVVLMGIGMAVLFAKHLLPDRQRSGNTLAFRYLPVASAAIITCAGILMTGVALGVIRPFAGM